MNWNRLIHRSCSIALLPLCSMFSQQVPAAGLLNEWSVGKAPVAAAMNLATNKVYVVNSGDGSVSVADPTTGNVVNLKVGANPSQAAVNPVTNKIYVANTGDNSVSVIDGATNMVTRVAAGVQPLAVAVNDVTNKIYVTNFVGGSVSVINGANNAVTPVTVGGNPGSIAVNVATNKVYVANAGSNSVSVIDGATNQVATISVGTKPVSVAVNAATNKIYVANQGNNSLSRIDGTNNSVTPVSVGPAPRAVAVDPASNTAYVANGGDNTVSVLDETARTNSIRPSGGRVPTALAVLAGTGGVAVGNSDNVTLLGPQATSYTFPATYAGKGAAALAVNPVTAKLFAVSPSANILRMLDPNLPALRSIALAPLPFSPFSAEINPVTNRIYATDEVNSVHVIDGVAGTVTPLAVGGRPRKPAVNPITNTAYVSVGACDANVAGTLRVINGAALGASIPMGHCPQPAVVNPATNRIYVANALDNSVSVVDGALNTVIATVQTGTRPIAVAINQATNTIYVANYFANTVSVINGATNSTTSTVTVAQPNRIAVDARANLVYVLTPYGELSVIDGSGKVTTVPLPDAAGSSIGVSDIAVNEFTGQAYVAVEGNLSGSISRFASIFVYQGATLIRANSESPGTHASLAINRGTNQIYMPNGAANNVTLLDGATFNRSLIASGANSSQPLVNPMNNRAYVLGRGLAGLSAGGNVIVPSITSITPGAANPAPASIAITALTGSRTASATPTFTIAPVNPLPANALPVRQVYYQLDTQTGPWKRATPNGTNWQASLTGLANGVHILYAFAGDGNDASAANTGSNGSPLAGKVVAYMFVKG
jgi:YVTN family beta-propeller protein